MPRPRRGTPPSSRPSRGRACETRSNPCSFLSNKDVALHLGDSSALPGYSRVQPLSMKGRLVTREGRLVLAGLFPTQFHGYVRALSASAGHGHLHCKRGAVRNRHRAHARACLALALNKRRRAVREAAIIFTVWTLIALVSASYMSVSRLYANQNAEWKRSLVLNLIDHAIMAGFTIGLLGLVR